ncbi:MAG: LysR family glycine cleavage system transcriptional activator [Planctomycetota bacterium]|jgi:LysR family glycine cleavage system transcriptional activator
MKHHLPSLDSLKVFEAAARHLSFSVAADELCLSKAAISYQIRKLELSLDAALFRRSVRQVYLTSAGQELYQTCQQVFRDLGQTIGQIRPVDGAHDVLIGVTTYVALRWLSPRIARFNEEQAEVSILLQHSVNSSDFRMQDVDFAIRWGPLVEEQRRAPFHQLAMPLFPVCSPRLLQRAGFEWGDQRLPCKALAQSPLAQLPLLCEDRPFDLWQAWYGEQGPALDNPRRIIADANVRTQAAIDGQGWTMADALMQAELDRGQLLAPFNTPLSGYGYAFESYPGRYLSKAASLLRDWLVASV